MKIIHVEKMDSDLGLVLSGGKGVGDGNIILSDIVSGKSAHRLVEYLHSRLEDDREASGARICHLSITIVIFTPSSEFFRQGLFQRRKTESRR